MTRASDLLALEKQFWTGDADFYRSHLDDQCLVAFKDMAGIMSKDEVAAMVKKDPPKWSNLQFHDKGLVEPADGVAILSYEASGTRGNGQDYKAVVSSGYAKRGGSWKLLFHQQTPH